MEQCPHKILEIPCTASEDEIKRAYRRMAIQYHPDRNKTKEAEEKMKLINKAYAILTGKEKPKPQPAPPPRPTVVVQYGYSSSGSSNYYTWTWTSYTNS